MKRLNYFFSSFTAFKLEQLLFFFTVLFIPTQIGKHFWPDFTTIFSIKTDYFSPVIYGWDVLVVCLLLVYVAQRKKFKAAPLFGLLFFYFTQVLSLFGAENIGAGIVRLEQYVVIGLFALYVASQKFEIIRESLFWGLSIGVLYSGVLAIAQVITGGTIGLWFLGERSFSLDTISIATFDWYGQVFLRAYATFAHPNVLAAFMLLAISIIIWLREEESKKLYLKYNLLVMSIGSIGLFLTFSRVVLIFYGFVFAYLLKNKIKLFGIIVLFLLPFLYVRFHSAFNFDQLSFIRREELAVQAFTLFIEKPLLGVGLNNFIYQLAYAVPVSGEIRFLQPVHNIFLLNLVETGIVGSFGFLVLLGTAIYSVVVIRKKRFLIFVWMCIVGLGFFDHYFLSIAQGQRLLFLVWGISMLEYENARFDKKSGRTNRLAASR